MSSNIHWEKRLKRLASKPTLSAQDEQDLRDLVAYFRARAQEKFNREMPRRMRAAPEKTQDWINAFSNQLGKAALYEHRGDWVSLIRACCHYSSILGEEFERRLHKNIFEWFRANYEHCLKEGD